MRIWLLTRCRMKQLAVFGSVFIVLNMLAFRYFTQDLGEVDLHSLAGHCIAIDAGHGGIDEGASGYGKIEKDINLAIAIKLADILKINGCSVVMTRENDIDYYKRGTGGKRHDLITRITMLNNSNADLFVSIHVNAIIGSRSSRGAQVFYHPKLEENKLFAETMQTSLSSIQMVNKRQIKQDLNILVLKGTHIPGVLVETGFISNPTEAILLASDEFQQKLAEALAKAIAYHLSHNVGR